ncbi:MAG: hypothetical protein KAS05_01785 [Candidatus Omnitrophica bacterium]|nr:hypothetical protein [Candidatus Omnitrophota bacterium]
MKEIQAILSERIRRASTVESFRFKPDEKIEFLPGQFLKLIFDQENRNNSDLNKFLSFSSAPGKEYFEVTKRISGSEFSQALVNLKIGDRILIKAPMGNCIFKDEYAKIGFLIGGIGITPVISILEYIVSKNLDTDICLLYSNRTEEDIAFKAQIDDWSQRNPNIKPVYAITDCVPKDKKCFSGIIDQQFLINNICELKQRIFFIFGSPGMVLAMKNVCFGIGCVGDMVKVENFIGY